MSRHRLPQPNDRAQRVSERGSGRASEVAFSPYASVRHFTPDNIILMLFIFRIPSGPLNHDADSHISPAPELMEFHLNTREHRFLLPSTHQKNSWILCSAHWILIVPGTNGGARKMHEHTLPGGDTIEVGHSECEQYFVLFNIVLCSSMFIDRDG